MELLAPLGAAAFVGLPAILLMYFLKVRGSDAPVGTLAFWPGHLVDRQANQPWKRLRFSRLLAVQLAVAAVLATVLMRPGLSEAAGARTTVVLIDGSPSMTATDVAPTRFQAAVARARELAGRMGPGQRMAVAVLGDHARLLAPVTSDAGAIREALGRARPSGSVADLDEGISLANALLRGEPEASVVLLGDGHLRAPAQPTAVEAPLRYEPVGRTGENVAVEAVAWTAQGDVSVRVANHGDTARDLSVEMRADGRLVDILPVRVDAGSSAEPVWTGLPPGTHVLEARMAAHDAFPLDDGAWLVTEPAARRRVLLVTKGNGFLSRALSLRQDVEVTTVDPGDYRPGGAFDLTVLDGFVPPGPEPLPEPALLVGPPAGAGPVPLGPPVDPGGLLPANPREPLLQYVSLRDVHVQEAGSVVVPPGWRTVIGAANGPLLVARQGEPSLAQLNFDLHRSDLPLRAAFPVLVQNLVSSLLPGGFEDQVLPLGEPVRLVASPGTTAVEVTTPGGASVRLDPPFPATLTDTDRPGVYEVRESGVAGSATAPVRRFVVQLQDPDQSRIAPGPEPLVTTVSRSARHASRGTLEIWPWVLALGLLGLLGEWTLFLRG